MRPPCVAFTTQTCDGLDLARHGWAPMNAVEGPLATPEQPLSPFTDDATNGGRRNMRGRERQPFRLRSAATPPTNRWSRSPPREPDLVTKTRWELGQSLPIPVRGIVTPAHRIVQEATLSAAQRLGESHRACEHGRVLDGTNDYLRNDARDVVDGTALQR
jgi:hypothetical protein